MWDQPSALPLFLAETPGCGVQDLGGTAHGGETVMLLACSDRCVKCKQCLFVSCFADVEPAQSHVAVHAFRDHGTEFSALALECVWYLGGIFSVLVLC